MGVLLRLYDMLNLCTYRNWCGGLPTLAFTIRPCDYSYEKFFKFVKLMMRALYFFLNDLVTVVRAFKVCNIYIWKTFFGQC